MIASVRLPCSVLLCQIPSTSPYGKELYSNNLLAGNIFIMELREEFSVCLNNEALSRVRVYLYKPFYSRERESAKLRGTILSENREKKHETWRQVNI